MKAEELSDYIGEIDEELIAEAKKKRSTNKRIFLITGSIAACMVIAVTGIFLAGGRKNAVHTGVSTSEDGTEKGVGTTSGIITGGPVSEIPHTEESYDNSVEMITSDIFYVKDGRIEKTPAEHEAKPETVFELWKKMNNVGDEVKLISVKIESNGITEESELDGQGVATYHVGADLTFNLTITKNIEGYYSKTSKRLLLNSLERTMYEASQEKYGDFNLILEEE